MFVLIYHKGEDNRQGTGITMQLQCKLDISWIFSNIIYGISIEKSRPV